jgi:transcriptional regulator with XRE-family HTH domain
MGRRPTEPAVLVRSPHDIAQRPPWARDIYEARVAAGLTQREVAAAIGRSRVYLTLIETGSHRPSETRLTRIRVAIADLVWRRLVDAQPALLGLEDELRTIASRDHTREWCASEVWRCPAGARARIGRLVGWRYPFDPVLGAPRAYDAAKAHLRSLLPPCRHDGACRQHGGSCAECFEAC